MKLFFLTTLLCAFSVIVPASAQKRRPVNPSIERIAQKYKLLNAKADYVTVNGAPIAKETRFIQPEDEVVPDYSNLHQIALVRHGEPDILKTGKFTHEQARQYVTMYDSVGILVPDKPFLKLRTPRK